jgi:hypothetical protein
LLFSVLSHQEVISVARKYCYKTRRNCDFSGFARGVVEVYILGCGAASPDNLFMMFQDNIAVSFSRTLLPLNMRQLHCLKTSGTSYLMTQPIFPAKQ